MALNTPQTIPFSAHPTHFTNTHQTDTTGFVSTNEPEISSQAKPTLGNKCMPAHEMLKRQWQKEALAEFSANLPKRKTNESPQLQHARKLLKIAKQQQSAGIHFEGQLTVEQAKLCVSLAQKKEDNSTLQQFSNTAAEALNMVKNMFSAAWPSSTAASETNPAWLEAFEAAAAPYFNINKSPLWKPGTAPSLIVLGDGNHGLAEVQIRLREFAKFLVENGAMSTLVVEYVDPPSKRECLGLSSESAVRCVGGDHIESTQRVELHIKRMWQAAFDLANELYQFAKIHGVADESLHPSVLMRNVYQLNYEQIIHVYSSKILPYYRYLEPGIEADLGANLKISDQDMAFKVAYSEFSAAVMDTAHARSAHLMQTLDVQIKSGQTVVAVFGDAHVQYNAEALLKNYDCWVLDDKSSDYTFPKKDEL